MADGKLNGATLPVDFMLGDRVISGASIKPMSFQTFVSLVDEANTMTKPKTMGARLRRLRMAKQVVYYANGSAISLSPLEVLAIPIPATLLIASKLDSDGNKEGKIVRDGNGIDQAITYELGTPISGGKDKPPVTELEFLAKTYGDIEDIMAAPSTILQTAEMLATIAKPLGTTLQQMPEWMRNQITVTDGLFISNEILPRFLELPADSTSE